MRYYERLLEMGWFTRDEVIALTGNHDALGSVLKNIRKKVTAKKSGATFTLP
jgi:metallophosphoesterase superfamily enzyme